MRKKPFVWFLVNRAIDLKSLKEYNDNLKGNFGLILSHYAIERNGTEIIHKIKSSFEIPLAFIFHDKRDLEYEVPDILQKKMFSLELKSLKYLELNKSYVPCYKITIPKKQELDINRLLLNLSDYFLFRSSFPLREAVVAFNPEDGKAIAELYRIMVKLGVCSVMVGYSKINVEVLQPFLNDEPIKLHVNAPKIPKLFDEWRTQIDALDHQLIETLAKRLQIVSEMGTYKSQQNMPLFEPERWQEILKSRKKIAKTKNVDEELIGKIFEAIHLSALKKMLEE